VAIKNNFSIRDTLRWILDALDEAASAAGVDARLIVSLVRHEFLDECVPSLLHALASESEHPRLVGLDLAGDEEFPFNPVWERTLRTAREDLGLALTVHAGETGRVDNVRWAVEACGARRIGHGLAAATDRELLDLLRSRDICVETCLTSNYLTQWVPDLAEHPVRRFIEEGVPFVLCADNPQIHAKGLTAEYELFAELFGHRELLTKMYATQMQFAFGDSR
jgi:adenosine deaminase